MRAPCSVEGAHASGCLLNQTDALGSPLTWQSSAPANSPARASWRACMTSRCTGADPDLVRVCACCLRALLPCSPSTRPT